MRFPKSRLYRNGNETATLEANVKGYSITYAKDGHVFCHQTFYVSDGWNRAVGRTEALRELKRGHFVEVK